MDNVILTEAFKELKLLEEESFDISSADDIEDAKDFLTDDSSEEIVEIADVYADEESELPDSYMGKVILECNVCHSKIFEDADKVDIDEENEAVNMEEECPYCFSNDGYKVIGQVAPFGQVEEEITVAEEEPVEDEIADNIESEIPEEEVDEDEIVEESFRGRRGKKINESRRTRRNRKINESRDSELYSALERAVKTHTDGLLIFSKPGSGVETLISKWAKSKGINIITANSEDLADIGGKVVADYEKGRANRISTFEEDPNSILLVRDAERAQSDLLTALKKFLCVIAISYGDVGDFDRAIKTHFYTFDFLNESLKEGCCKKGKCKNYALDECGDLEECDGSCKDDLDEDFKDVSITTDDSHMTMTSDDDGKVTVTTEPIHDEFIEDEFIEDEVGDEMIAPVDDETVAEIEGEEESPEFDDEDVEDVDIEEFDEEGFDELGESYLKKVYENVNSFKTTKVRERGNKLQLEGIIGFKSGSKKKTSFLFEAKDINEKGKIRFIGENKEITRGKKSFTVAGKMMGKKFMCESLNYNYRAKDETGKSTRLYGTVKIK